MTRAPLGAPSAGASLPGVQSCSRAFAGSGPIGLALSATGRSRRGGEILAHVLEASGALEVREQRLGSMPSRSAVGVSTSSTSSSAGLIPSARRSR